MSATYRALCDHGYAELTMQDIADETDKSKAALHYHYDSKQELLLAFLDHLYDEFTARVHDQESEAPADRLGSFVDGVLTPTDSDDDERVAFRTALLELKAQAPYDETIRDRLQRFDEFVHGRVRDLVAAGVESGDFRDVDPEDTARFIVTVLDGAQTKQVAVGQDIDCTRRMLHTYIETHLIADGEIDSDADGETDTSDADATPKPAGEASE